jgi:RNA polymerase sigma-70 factor (ECF subfamily)
MNFLGPSATMRDPCGVTSVDGPANIRQPLGVPESLQQDRTMAAAKAGDERAFRALIEPYRRELRAYCYRMAGSLHDGDDLLQESLLRAWKGIGGFEGRSSLRTWLYRVSSSACMDALESRAARSLPTFGGEPASPDDPVPPPELEPVWLEPCPGSFWSDAPASPDARFSAKESVGLAFLAALQLLTPRQRAVLIARDVLGWTADECASVFDTTVAATNSTLQRAREALDEQAPRWKRSVRAVPDEPTTRALLARYVQAWEHADASLLVTLLHEDATLTMPPLPIWLRGARAIAQSIGGMVLTPDARGAFRFVTTQANGLPALAAYRKNEQGVFAPNALHVIAIEGDRIRDVTAFLDARLLAAFDLPAGL